MITQNKRQKTQNYPDELETFLKEQKGIYPREAFPTELQGHGDSFAYSKLSLTYEEDEELGVWQREPWHGDSGYKEYAALPEKRKQKLKQLRDTKAKKQSHLREYSRSLYREN